MLYAMAVGPKLRLTDTTLAALIPAAWAWPEDMTETTRANRIGYARVSTYGQSLDVQRDQLAADGCATVDREKASGARIGQQELERRLRKIKAGDLVMVMGIDQLARSSSTCSASSSRSSTQAGYSDHRQSHEQTPKPGG